ncbi:MAG: hypothetical protein CMI71_04200 [Candidatus Pelagibacter sp.]|mgnify:CR=1 FL=1|nr:hypothetical protein [Candidatus Pelagibacter sp.]|tara:strand:- start:146 stop:352 length:207 start_codon:yes stop_codon:yes gene_type:complete
MSLNESNMSEANKHINHYTTEESIDKKVNLTDLLARLEVEKKKEIKKNVALSTAAISAIAVFGIILTL